MTAVSPPDSEPSEASDPADMNPVRPTPTDPTRRAIHPPVKMGILHSAHHITQHNFIPTCTLLHDARLYARCSGFRTAIGDGVKMVRCASPLYIVRPHRTRARPLVSDVRCSCSAPTPQALAPQSLTKRTPAQNPVTPPRIQLARRRTAFCPKTP